MRLGFGKDHQDLTHPVSLDRRRTNDQVRSSIRGFGQPENRLAGLPQAHVVGEYRASAAKQKRKAFNLMRIEGSGNPPRLGEAVCFDLQIHDRDKFSPERGKQQSNQVQSPGPGILF